MAKKTQLSAEVRRVLGKPRRWSRLKTIRKLQAHFECIDRHHFQLLREPIVGNIRRHFKSQHEAFAAAYVIPDYVLETNAKEHRKQYILHEIRYRLAGQRSLRPSHPNNKHLVSMACDAFGSWQAALAAAGAPAKERKVPARTPRSRSLR